MRATGRALALMLQSGMSEVGSRGSGGRASVSGVTATVFGATGFVGRYVVNELGRHGTQVVVPWRGDGLNHRHLKLMGDLGQIVPVEFHIRDEESVRRAMQHSDVVINLMGKHYETRNFSYTDVHVTGSDTIARIAKQCGVHQFVQMSCANASPVSPSAWNVSKYAAEQAVRAHYPDAVIVRATDIFGYEDRLLNRICQLLQKTRRYPIIDYGEYMLQPVYMQDIAVVMGGIVRDPEGFAGQTLVLAGPAPISMADLVEFCITETKMLGGPVHLPRQVAPFLGKLLGLRLPLFNPNPIVPHDAFVLECTNNILREEPGILTFEDLDYVPHGVTSEQGADVVRMYRRGGDRSSLFYVAPESQKFSSPN